MDADLDTGLAVILVGQNADNAIIIISGANMAIDTSDLARLESVIEKV